jgi:antitoxin (DNA-binding transcriptional repressor) of toxin-antitoxin stability system
VGGIQQREPLVYISITEAAERLDELVDLVAAGQEVILTRDGERRCD